MGAVAFIALSIAVSSGVIWYLIYSRPKVKREFALIYVVQRITSKDLAKGLLGAELRELIMERDEVTEDRFDHLIRNCDIIDLKEKVSLEEFLKIVSSSLAPKLNLSQDILFNALLTRERESPTIINPGLAIPHVTIEGEKKFEILITRCKEGIIFSSTLPPVHTIFVLVGSRDERNFHLRALAAIAQIASSADFETSWLNAKGVDELRDIILLGERRRHP
jgi:mannitol/fructose-specific phosphotransferase system IIA component (Ntr-type)